MVEEGEFCKVTLKALGPSRMALVVKNLPANARDTRDRGSIPGLGSSPGRGHGNPLQYSCLENPKDRGAWWATVHGVKKSQTRRKKLSTHIHSPLSRDPQFIGLDIHVNKSL